MSEQISRTLAFLRYVQFSRDQLIFAGKQRGLDLEGMDTPQAIHVLLAYDFDPQRETPLTTGS